MINGMSKIRFGGLNSGVDTESIVNAMTAGTKLRINNNKRRVLMLQAQQNAFRDVISKIQDLQNNFLNSTRQATNLRSATVFRQTKASVFTNGVAGAPSGVTVTTGVNATPATYNVTVLSNATKSVLNGAAYETGKPAIDFDEIKDYDKFMFSISVGGTTRSIYVERDTDTLETAINKALDGAFNGLVTIDDKGVITDRSRRTIAVSSVVEVDNTASFDFDSASLKTGTNSFVLQVGNVARQVEVNTLAQKDDNGKDTFWLLFDGGGAFVDESDLNDHLAAIAKERYDAALATALADWTDWRTNTATTEELQAWHDAAVLFRVDEARYNGIITDFNNWVDQYKLDHSGEEPSAAAANAKWVELAEAWDTTNKAAATATIEAELAADPDKVFTVVYANGVHTNLNLVTAYVHAEYNQRLEEFNTITQALYDRMPESYRDTTTVEVFRAGLSSDDVVRRYNQMNLEIAVESLTWANGEKVKVDFNAVGKATLATENGTGITVRSGDGTFGITNDTFLNPTNMSVSHTLAQLGIFDDDVDSNGDAIARKGAITINGVEIEVTSRMTVSELMNRVTNSAAGVTMTFSSLTNGFTLTAKQDGTAGRMRIDSDQDDIFKTLGLTQDRVKDGTNLMLDINGVEVEAAGSSYTIDGTTFTFEPHVTATTTFRVEVGANTSGAVDVIKNFVQSYNKMIDDIFAVLGERPNKSFHFLTDEDKRESGMSDREIEQWESMARKGLLHRNSAINRVMLDMRAALNRSVLTDSGSPFSIYSVVGNSGNRAFSLPSTGSIAANTNGKLHFDEQALLEALERDPEDIIKLFTDPDSGLMRNLESVINGAIGTMGPAGQRGTLIRQAGLATGVSATDNMIHRQIESLNKTIENLNRRYERQQDRFWRMYTAMDKQFAAFNAQSDYIMGMFANMGNNR